MKPSDFEGKLCRITELGDRDCFNSYPELPGATGIAKCVEKSYPQKGYLACEFKVETLNPLYTGKVEIDKDEKLYFCAVKLELIS